jgi:hypothetical protein
LRLGGIGPAWIRPLGGIVPAASAILWLASCSGENPAKDSPFECDHVDADGVELTQGNVTFNRQFNGENTGGLAVPAGETVSGIEVTFLEEDRVDGNLVAAPIEIDPACPQALAVMVDDPSIAQASPSVDEPWRFQLQGLQEGETTLQVAIVHADHNDFLSLPVPVSVTTVVTDPPIQPQAMFVRDGPNPIATWNHHENGPGESTGPMLVRVGETRAGLEAVFEGAWDDGGGGHGSGGRPEIPVPAGPYALRWTVASEAVGRLQARAGEVTRFDLVGVGVGATTVVLELLFQGNPILTSGAIPVVCVDPAAPAVASPSFTCVASGLKSVIIDRGAVLPAFLPGQGAPCGWWTPGAFDVGEGMETTLYSVREFRVDPADSCDTVTLPDTTYRLSFTFSDPSVVRVTNHPFHWDEITIFHVNGLQAGTTEMTLVVTRADTGALHWISPPMPVTVAAP